MDGMESRDIPPPTEYRDNHEGRTVYQGIRAQNVHTMINGNVSNHTKNSHRPTKTVVGILGFVAIGLIVLVAVLVTHYTNDSKSNSSSKSPYPASIASSNPIATNASPSSSIRNTQASKTTSPAPTLAAAVSAVTTPETETVTSTSSGFATTYLSVCDWGCPGYACHDVNDCRDPYCCNRGTCDASATACGPSPSCSEVYSGIC